MSDGRPGYVPWPNVKVVFALLAVALVAFVGSFLVAGPTTDVVRVVTVRPISTTAGQPQTILLPHSRSKNASYDLRLRFRFQIDVMRTGETLFHVGSTKTGITAWVSEPLDGYRYVVLSAPSFSAALVNHVVVGQTYAVTVAIDDGGTSITATVDGQRPFSYNYLASVLPALRSATVGGPVKSPQPLHPAKVKSPPQTPLSGSVSDFTLSSRELMPAGSGSLISALRILAGVAVFASVILFALRIATGSLVAERVGLSARTQGEFPQWLRLVRKHGVKLGLILLVAGIALVATVTPLDNAVVQQSGSQYLAATDVGPNQKTTYALFGEPKLFANAASLDVHLAFQMRLDGAVSLRSGLNPVVSTLGDGNGLRFQMHRATSPFLTGIMASSNIWRLPTYTFLWNFPLHQWVSISVDVQRSQSFVYMVDGQQVQSFTFNYPVLHAAPTMLTANGTFGGSVRNVTMNVTLFRQDPSRVPYLLIRLAQSLGIVAIIAATILLAQRFLSKLIPAAVRIQRPLVLTTFGAMGIGIVINIFSDLFRFQATTVPAVERNMWLYTQYVRFSDFFQPYQLLHSLNPYNIQQGSYPPVGYWILAPLLWMNQYAAVFVFLALVIGFLVWWLLRSFTVGMPYFHRFLIVAVAMLSLPVSFAIDRSNNDLIIFIIVVLGIASFEEHRDTMAALWIGLAGAAKVLPILYLLLFLRGRKLRYIALGILFAGAATLLGFAGFRYDFFRSLAGFRHATSALQGQYRNASNATALYFNASVLGWAQSIGLAISGNNGAQAANNAINPFMLPVEILSGLALAWYLRWREDSFWRSVTLITVAFILLNQVSYYYDLLFLFVPLSLFVKYATINRRGLIISVLFGFVLAPRAYFYFGNSRVDFSVLTTAPLLLALGVAVVYDGYRERANHAVAGSVMAPDEASEVAASLSG